jgi:hypothetical protein
VSPSRERLLRHAARSLSDGEQSSAAVDRRARNSTASVVSLRLAYGCFSPAMHERATQGRRHQPGYCFSTASADHRVARIGVAHPKLPCGRPSRSLRPSGSAQAGRCYATAAVTATGDCSSRAASKAVAGVADGMPALHACWGHGRFVAAFTRRRSRRIRTPGRGANAIVTLGAGWRWPRRTRRRQCVCPAAASVQPAPRTEAERFPGRR